MIRPGAGNSCIRRCAVAAAARSFRVLEDAMGLAAAARLILPVALDLISRFINNHVPLRAIHLDALARLPFGAHLLVTQCSRLVSVRTTRPLKTPVPAEK